MSKKYLFVALIIVVVAGVLWANMAWRTNKPTTPSQTLSLTSTITSVSSETSMPGWKRYSEKAAFIGMSFGYPADWTLSQGNAGPVFTSPDNKIVFSISGPYPDSIDTLVKQLSSSQGTKITNQTKENFKGHPAIRLESAEEEETKKSITSISEYIGNVKIISHWQNGSLDIEYRTVVPGITIMDNSQQDNGVATYNKILSTIIFTN